MQGPLYFNISLVQLTFYAKISVDLSSSLEEAGPRQLHFSETVIKKVRNGKSKMVTRVNNYYSKT